ncbi:MAG: hypothetical protein JO201_02965, partial [Verrucomicrobia bacterium]|nr:hypothetical protein [Verrucomicrobiota bacterium]
MISERNLLCNSELKQKNHRSHDQTDHSRNGRVGIHCLDRVQPDEIQSFALDIAYTDANTGAPDPVAKDTALTACSENDTRAENNADAESGETDARAEDDSSAHAAEIDA